MTRRAGMAVLLCGVLVASSRAHGEAGADFASEVEIRVLKLAESELGRIEKQLRAHPDVKAGSATNITLPLQSAIEEDLGRGPVKLHPRAIFEACLLRLQKGDAPSAVGKALVELYRRGDFARAASVDAGTKVEPKKVASFVFDKERVRSPDPHLPNNFKSAPGEKVKGVYQICVDTQGKVTKVSTVQSIPGADQSVMDQVQATWLYKPQPVPVCTTRAFVFQFN